MNTNKVNPSLLEYITMEEACMVTGYKNTHLRDLGTKADIPRIGKPLIGSFFRDAFFFFIWYRDKEMKNIRANETGKMREYRINQEWKRSYDLHKEGSSTVY